MFLFNFSVYEFQIIRGNMIIHFCKIENHFTITLHLLQKDGIHLHGEN